MTTWLKNNRGFLVLLLGLGLFRSAIADWNTVPSGSLRPSILEGDVVLVNRLAYDLKIPLTGVSLVALGEPARGDIVTFSSPKDGTRLIKRLVAVPGDRVALRHGVLVINDEPASYTERRDVIEPVAEGVMLPALRATERIGGRSHSVQFLAPFTLANDFGPVVVPPGQYFMLGDNRHNSADSRIIGFVPRRLLIGRAERTIVSADILDHWAPRFERTWARLE